MLFSKEKHILDKMAGEIRLEVLEMIYRNGGHIGGSLSCVDILIALYFGKIFNFKKDRFVISAGHLAPVVYAILAKAGYFDKKILNTYGKFGSKLQGHVNTEVEGVVYSSGSLGQGLSFALGMALADKEKNIVCLTTDGEHNEGQIWESIQIANKFKDRLKNLINIVDINGIQVDGRTNEIMPLLDLKKKYNSFGWEAIETNGHNFEKIEKALVMAKKGQKPVVILAKTILAKGIDFMEGDFKYHDIKNMDEKMYSQAKISIEKKYGQ